MTRSQTARVLQWVRSKTSLGNRKVCFEHLSKTCPARVPVAITSTEEYLAVCTCNSLLLTLGTFVYAYDVRKEIFSTVGEQQGGVVWVHPEPVPIPVAIRR
jgi:hypothetical protein